MKADIRRKLSMTARALDFSTANPSDQASIKTVVTRLETLVNRADELSVQQRSGAVDEQLAIAQRAVVRRAMRRDQMNQLLRLANSVKKSHPELKGLFRMPRYGATNRDFLIAAQDMLVKVIAQKPLLDTLGLGETLVDDLTRAVAAYTTATEGAHAGRSSHVGASSELEEVVNDGVAVVGVLDSLNRPRFRDEPELLAAWISASNVRARAKKTTAAGPAPTPPTPAAIKEVRG